MLVLSVQQTMRGKLDKRDLLKQKLQKNWAMKNISLMLIICGVLGFPDGVFQERRWAGLVQDLPEAVLMSSAAS